MQLLKYWLAVARTFIVPCIACTPNLLGFVENIPSPKSGFESFAEYTQCVQGGSVRLVSTREIQAGEEICVRHAPGEIQWDCFHPILVCWYSLTEPTPSDLIQFLALFLDCSFILCSVFIQLILMTTPTVCNAHSATEESTWLVYPIQQTKSAALFALVR